MKFGNLADRGFTLPNRGIVRFLCGRPVTKAAGFHCKLTLLFLSNYVISVCAQTEAPPHIDLPLQSLFRFCKSTTDIKLTSRVHHKIHHGDDVTRDDKYLIHTSLKKQPPGLLRELVIGEKSVKKEIWDGSKMWLIDHENPSPISWVPKGNRLNPTLGINHKFSLQGVNQFVPNGLFLWEALLFEDDIRSQIDSLREHSRLIGDEVVRSDFCWVTETVFEVGDPNSPPEVYQTHISSKLWIRKSDGAPLRCSFVQEASQGVWQMRNQFISDFVDIQVNTTLDDRFFEYVPPEDVTIKTWKQLPFLSVGDEAPDFEFTDISGEVGQLTDYQERIIIASFTAPTCSNCRAVYPHLQRIHDTFGEEVAILPIYNQDRPEVVRDYFTKNRLSIGPVRVSSNVPSEFYRVYSTPITYIIDKELKVLRVFNGYPNDASPENPPEQYDIFGFVEKVLSEQ